MNGWQALDSFWQSFDWPAYDESSVPTGDKAPAFPYITYHAEVDTLGNPIGLYGSLWDRSSSWENISLKALEIGERLRAMPPIPMDIGYLYMYAGTPFAQRMSDESDEFIRRIYINIGVEFLTDWRSGLAYF